MFRSFQESFVLLCTIFAMKIDVDNMHMLEVRIRLSPNNKTEQVDSSYIKVCTESLQSRARLFYLTSRHRLIRSPGSPSGVNKARVLTQVNIQHWSR